MFTGYFAKLRVYEQNGLIPVAICGGVPNWYKGLWYKKLAPKWTFFNEWNRFVHNWYRLCGDYTTTNNGYSFESIQEYKRGSR